MEPRKTEQEAWIDFLSNELNAVSVRVDGGYIIVKRHCSNCGYYMTYKTKYCHHPCSTGCWQFKYKKGIDHENSNH
jgi:hypothetical protein